MATLTKKLSQEIEVAARKAERERQKHSAFMSRTLSIYRNQQARLRKEAGQADAALPFTLEEFRAWFQAGLDRGCGYTGERLTVKTAAADHDYPIKHGGSWALDNLVLCTSSANFAKGELSGEEFRALLAFAEASLCGASRVDMKRRLAAGGKMARMRF